MSSIERVLESMGLTETEANIYLAGLPHAFVTLPQLAKLTSIKRPTLYHALQTLLEKGLVSERKEANGRSQFAMSSPESFRALVEQQSQEVASRMKMLNTLLPDLAKRQNASKEEEVSVVQYHGIQGMKMAIDIACYCRSKKWDIIAPYQNFLRDYDSAYAQHYLRARKAHRITSRTLWELTPETRPMTPGEIRERNPRLMPKTMQGKFKSMIILFDDKVAVFSSYQKLSAIIISSKEIQDMYRAMFDTLWEISKPF